MQHISTITDTMMKPCPLCGAKPFQPCSSTYGPGTGRTGRRAMRVTHIERNRA